MGTWAGGLIFCGTSSSPALLLCTCREMAASLPRRTDTGAPLHIFSFQAGGPSLSSWNLACRHLVTSPTAFDVKHAGCLAVNSTKTQYPSRLSGPPQALHRVSGRNDTPRDLCIRLHTSKDTSIPIPACSDQEHVPYVTWKTTSPLDGCPDFHSCHDD